jgi:hypothetical protein
LEFWAGFKMKVTRLDRSTPLHNDAARASPPP